ncbi:hypothetical protein EP331_08395 [bacterium]|nr:MAG: hypothetical protein EP331_08395 [bacterium]
MHPQEKQLLQLIQKAKDTEFGKKCNFAKISSYQEFVQNVPITTYDTYREGVERLKNGVENIYWPGKVNHFAVSSGTTGEGKHIPITKERIQSDTIYRKRVVKELLFSRYGWNLLSGKHISLPGGLEYVESDKHSYWIGEVSGISSLHVPKWMKKMQVLPLSVSKDWSISQKVDYILRESAKADVRSITGAPTWIAKVLSEIIRLSGKKVSSIWPHLSVIISGGVAYRHYKQEIESYLDNRNVCVLEMYGASEGYIGYSDYGKPNVFNVQLNNGMFFELKSQRDGFIPISDYKPNEEYSIYVSNNSGLWRYPLKDIVMFDSFGKLSITGRLDLMSDYFGESLLLSEIKETLSFFNISYSRIFLAPKTNPNGIVLFVESKYWPIKEDMKEAIDKHLMQINRHYSIRRESNTLQQIKIIEWNSITEKRYLDQNCNKAQLKIPEIITDAGFSHAFL